MVVMAPASWLLVVVVLASGEPARLVVGPAGLDVSG
jgi:hypothetical protein